MKPLAPKAPNQGITLLETLVLLIIVFILVALLSPAHIVHRKALEALCRNNLKQIDLEFLIFESDYNGKFPMQVPVAQGGTMEFINSGHTFPHFEKVTQKLTVPTILTCPYDKAHQAITNWEALNDLSISYFLNVDVSTNNPSQSILSGDRFLLDNGRTVNHGLFTLTSNENITLTGR